MAFWTRVRIETSVEDPTATGNPRLTWSTFISDVEARLLPLMTDEAKERWGTPEEDAYEVQLRQGALGIRPRMRVVAGSEVYDIRHISEPPPFGEPVTVLQAIRVTP